MSDLQKLILATLAYYDLFDFPLTAEEIGKYLVAPGYLKISDDTNLDAISAELYTMTNTGQIALYERFYGLPHREHLVPVRIKKTRIAKEKMKLARRAAFLMSLMPFVRTVFASGSLALENTDYDSDLDLFIITGANRIWTARFFINSVFDLLLLKRKPEERVAPDKICPNHLIADNALAIINRNVFTARVYSHLVPLYRQKNVTLKNFQQENQWIHSYVSSWNFSNQYLVRNYGIIKGIKNFQELILNTKIGDLVEKLCCRYQKHRIEKNPLTRHPQGRIEYNDCRLEFHPHSIENVIITDYSKRLECFFKNVDLPR